MARRRSLPPLLRAAFAAGFSIGKIASSWNRLVRELDRRAVHGPWRSVPKRRSTGRRSRSAPQGILAWLASPLGVTAVIVFVVLATLFPGFFNVGKYLPASLFVVQTDQELTELRTRVITAGQGYLNTPYLYGSTDPSRGLDCSGFVIATFKSLGYTFPTGVRSSRDMFTVGDVLTREEIKAGDLVFFATDPTRPNTVAHVAIAMGNDKIIHANSYVGHVNIDPLFSSQYFASTYVGARRVLGSAGQNRTEPLPDPGAPQPDYDYMPPSDESRPLTEPVLAAAGPFPDVAPDHPNAVSIALLKDRGVIGGYDDGTFKPARTVSRVELLKFGFKACGAEASVGESAFSDVPSTHWGTGFIATAAANGWVSGYGDGRFGPDNTVTVAEASKILLNVCGVQVENPPTRALYADVDPTSWMAPYLAEVKANSLIAVPGDSISPNSGMNRAKVAEFMVRTLRSLGRA